MIRNYSSLALFSLLVLLLVSCKKDNDKPPVSTGSGSFTSAVFKLQLKSNVTPFIWDSLNNTNAAGNPYSVNRINMYVSNITLKRENGLVFTFNRVYYIDASDSLKSLIKIDSIPSGNYIEMTFLLGLDSLRNVDYGLPSSMDNLNMAWPTAMGGGYHFLKMEGHYLDSIGGKNGYAIHLGKNPNLPKMKIVKFMQQQNTQHHYSLVFNTNEVFANPYTYNLNRDVVYTMSDSTAMYKIKTNIEDAFSLIQNN